MNQTDARRYLAGAALAFGIILVEVLLIRFALFNYTSEEIAALDPTIYTVLLLSPAVAGAVGGYLVARRIASSFLRIGLIVSIIAYLFELIYNLLILGVVTDIFLFFALLAGGVIGAALHSLRQPKPNH